MNLLKQFEKWNITQQPRWLVFLRVALGIILFHKGINFIYDNVELEKILSDSGVSHFNSWLPLVITWLHLLCGSLIIIGLMTRLAAFVMIPILIFAVILNATEGIFTPGSEFLLSLITLSLLIFFFIRGGGYLSMDMYMKKYLL